MASLKHVDLFSCFPADGMSLSAACQLRLTLTEEDFCGNFSVWGDEHSHILHWGSVPQPDPSRYEGLAP